jgi:hypothetical protein
MVLRLRYKHVIMRDADSIHQASSFPNLRRLFVEARTDAEESVYSRNAVRWLGPWFAAAI